MAPFDNPGALVVEVTAVSVTTRVEGSATVQVAPASFTISPPAPAVALGGELQLAADWNGDAGPAFNWSSDKGTIDQLGRYVAPGAFSGVITSADPGGDLVRVEHRASGQRLEVRVRLHFRTPFISGTSGPTAPGDTLTLTGTNLATGLDPGGATYVLFPDGAGGEFPVRATATPDQVTVVVPAGCSSGVLRVELRSDKLIGIPPAWSNPVPFELKGALRLHPDRNELAGGESTALRVALLGMPGPLPITFETDLGSVSGATYLAPPSITAERSANVRACVTGTSLCSGASILLRPLQFTPGLPLVAPGAAVQFTALADGLPASLVWTLGSGGGSVTPGGLYQASTALQDAGPSWLLASGAAGTLPVQVGVTGAVPGLLVRHTEPAPASPSAFTEGVPWGAAALALAVDGGRGYLLQGTRTGSYRPWIDVFDLTDPLKPSWLGAVAARDAQLERFQVAGGLLVMVTILEGERRLVDAYDLSGALPVLTGTVSAAVVPPVSTRMDWAAASSELDDGTLYLFDGVKATTSPVPLRAFPLSGGALAAHVDYLLEVPGGAPDAFGEVVAATASRGRAYVAFTGLYPLGSRLGAWDLSTNPARYLGSAPTNYNRRANYWSIVFGVAGRHLVLGRECYDLVPEVPAPVPCTFEPTAIAARASAGDRYVSGALHLDDYSVPDQPRRVANLDVPYDGGQGAMVGRLFLSPEGSAGLAIYDLGAEGGVRSAGLSATDRGLHSLLDSALDGGHLYSLASWNSWVHVVAWALSSSPPAFTSSTWLVDGSRVVGAGGGLLLVGTTTALQVWSVVDPAAPAWLGELPLDPATISVDGTTGWVGTLGGDLVSVDLSVPGAPLVMGRLALGAVAQSIVVHSPGRLLVAVATGDGLGGDLLVVDVTAPAAAVVIGAARLGAPAVGVASDGSTAAVATTSELITVDLADPAHPLPLAAVPIPATRIADAWSPHRVSAGLHLAGGLAWVAAGDRLLGYDLRRPRWPRLVSATQLSSVGVESGALTVDGARAFGYSTYDATIAELDLSQPRNVVLTLPPPAPPRQLSAP